MPAAFEAEIRSFRLQVDPQLYSDLAMMDPPADEGQVTPPWLLGAIELETAHRAKIPMDFFKLVTTMPFHTVALALKKFPDMRRQYLSELSDACPPSGQPKSSCQPSLYHLDT